MIDMPKQQIILNDFVVAHDDYWTVPPDNRDVQPHELEMRIWSNHWGFIATVNPMMAGQDMSNAHLLSAAPQLLELARQQRSTITVQANDIVRLLARVAKLEGILESEGYILDA